jgi:hypothetical protein
MSWYSTFKEYLFRRSLRRETAQQERLGEIRNYTNSRYIGIWFDGSNRENFIAIDAFARKLASKGKKVEILGYVGKVRKEETIKFDHIDPHRISWAGIPDANTKEIWAQIPYDLLLCLHTKPCKPLEYLANISMAKCKVGRYTTDTVDYYDLMVSLQPEKDVSQMIKQVDQLLNEINKNQQQNVAAI